MNTDEENLRSAAANWYSSKNELLYNNRFFPKNYDKFSELISLLCSTSKRIVPKDTILYRARLFNKCLPKKKRKFYGFDENGSFIAPKEATKNSRSNPQYISYLYTSEDRITALMEIRPTLEDKVSIAEILVNQSLSIANLVYEKNINRIDECFRFLLSREFGQPIRDESEYIFAQYLSEYIKNLGFDGIRYNSSINKSGVNLTIFNFNKCKAISSNVYQLSGITYEAELCAPQKGENIKNNAGEIYAEENKVFFCPNFKPKA
jgi:hypothetical protein